ncbi:MarR family winged helix-turn-helix transcriptional regulator [Entomohabitans teleogrylli]|uniref:MarR family winged helix-turn-helix transcriptional regulator n=1 Tax=Entomohabitans teleogrylli TaxID=1384589 RepID=UPI00073D8382|nr:MarR family transcriptional regulator [Entomohabitans teleogrylli]
MKNQTFLTAAALRVQLTRLSRRLRQQAQNDPHSWAPMLVLSAIDRLGEGITPGELGETERIQSSNLAAILRQLEQQQLIVRRQDQADRRKVRLFLTPAGRKRLEESRLLRDAWLCQAMDALLSEEEKKLLARAGTLMDKLAGFSSPGVDEQPLPASPKGRKM